MRKINALPIGYSAVKSVIETGYYVDKTNYAQALIENRNPMISKVKYHSNILWALWLPIKNLALQ